MFLPFDTLTAKRKSGINPRQAVILTSANSLSGWHCERCYRAYIDARLFLGEAEAYVYIWNAKSFDLVGADTGADVEFFAAGLTNLAF